MTGDNRAERAPLLLRHRHQLRRDDWRVPVRVRQRRHQRHGRWAADGFQFRQRRHGLQRRVDAARLRSRRVFRRQARGSIRPPRHHARRRRVLHRQRLGFGHRNGLTRVRRLPCAGRPGRRRSKRACAGLYQRGRTRALPRVTGDDSASRHHFGIVRGIYQQLLVGGCRRIVDGGVLVRFPGLAVDVLDRDPAGVNLPRRAVLYSRESAIPRVVPAQRQGARGIDEACRRGRGQGESCRDRCVARGRSSQAENA